MTSKACVSNACSALYSHATARYASEAQCHQAAVMQVAYPGSCMPFIATIVSAPSSWLATMTPLTLLALRTHSVAQHCHTIGTVRTRSQPTTSQKTTCQRWQLYAAPPSSIISISRSDSTLDWLSLVPCSLPLYQGLLRGCPPCASRWLTEDCWTGLGGGSDGSDDSDGWFDSLCHLQMQPQQSAAGLY